jgi:hypothetical protein
MIPIGIFVLNTVGEKIYLFIISIYPNGISFKILGVKGGFLYISHRYTNTKPQTSEIVYYRLHRAKFSDVEKSLSQLANCRK